MTTSITLWTKWVPVRKEKTADGTTSIYYGIGRVSWPSKRLDPQVDDARGDD